MVVICLISLKQDFFGFGTHIAYFIVRLKHYLLVFLGRKLLIGLKDVAFLPS